MVAAAACPGSRVEIEDVGLNPTRTDLVGVLRRFGARVEVELTSTDAGEPRGRIIVEGDRIGRLDIGPEEVPGLIDELPAIAALAGHGGEISVRGAKELRVKESDRIAVLVAGLRALGISAAELDAVAEVLASEARDFGAVQIACEKHRRHHDRPVPVNVAIPAHIPDRDVIPHNLDNYDEP